MTATRFALLALVATACAKDTETDTVDSGDDSGPEIDITPDGNTYAVLIRGTLFTTDLDEAKAAHDAVAGGGQAGAQAMGDLAHDVMLGVADGGFLALDRWDNLNGMNAVYSDPAFSEAFGTLFQGEPSQEIFVHQPTWESWGDWQSGDAHDPSFFVVVRGTLAESDPVAAKAAHDAVAAGGKDAALAAGDLAHVVHTGLADPREFFAIDIWADPEAMGAFYQDPDIAAAFATLFEGEPNIGIYVSTDWLQW